MNRPLLVIVTGSRHWTDRRAVVEQLERARATGRSLVVIEGGARGADRFAGQWAARRRGRGVHWVRFRAPWDEHGGRAGVIRNQQMVDWAVDARREGWEPVCLAFPAEGSRGTWDMVKRCERALVPVRVVSS